LSPLRRLTGVHKVSRYHIHELSNGDRIGTCGITVKGITERSSSPGNGTTLDEEVDAARACVRELQENLHVNKIVVLSHVGYSFDVTKLAAIDGVDIVIGGHRHALLGDSDSFSSLLGWSVDGDYATIVHDACVVTAYAFSKIVGQLEVQFDADGRPISCQGTPRLPFNPDLYEVRDGTNDAKTGQPLYLDTEDAAILTEYLSSSRAQPFYPAGEDASVVEALRPFREQMNATLQRPLATVPENICHHTRFFRDSRRVIASTSNSGQAEVNVVNVTASADPLCPNRPIQSLLGGGVCHLVAQAYLDTMPGVDIALQNAGGCAADIQAGQFTISDALKVLPHADTLVTLPITGSQLRQQLEEAIEYFVNQDSETDVSGSSFPYGAGIRWDLNLSATFGYRLTSIEVNPRVDYDEDVWSPIDPTAQYLLVTNSYLAEGNNGYRTFSELYLTKEGHTAQENIFETTDATYEDWQSLIDYADDFSVLEDIPLSQYSTQSLVTLDGYVVTLRFPQATEQSRPTRLADNIMFRIGVFGTVVIVVHLLFLVLRFERQTLNTARSIRIVR
jgi:5'-nucleotidase / UDP-sugar diphosphatase